LNEVAARVAQASSKLLSALQDPANLVARYGDLFDNNGALIASGITTARAEQLSQLVGGFRLLDNTIVDAINELGALRGQFFDDLLAGVTDVNHICNNVEQLTPGRINAWKFSQIAGSNLKTNIIALDKLDFLKSAGVLDPQLARIAQLNDVPALELAESLAKRTPPFMTALDDIAEKAILLRTYKGDAITIINDMAKHPGYKNPEDLLDFISGNMANATQGGKPGWKYELDVYFDTYKNNPVEEFNFSKKVPAVSGNPPTKEVDFISSIKLMEIKTWGSLNMGAGNTILINLMDKIGQQVKKIDFTHPDNAGIVDRIGRAKIIEYSHPSSSMSWEQLRQILHQTYITKLDPSTGLQTKHLDELTELVIENANGKHTFYPTHWQNP